MDVICQLLFCEENQGAVRGIEDRMSVGFMKGGHWLTFEKRLGKGGENKP